MSFRLAAAVALTGVLISSGCASTDPAIAKDSPREELVYRTGSNIPVRDKSPLTQEEKDKKAEESRRTLQQMQTTGAGNPRIN